MFHTRQSQFRALDHVVATFCLGFQPRLKVATDLKPSTLDWRVLNTHGCHILIIYEQRDCNFARRRQQRHA